MAAPMIWSQLRAVENALAGRPFDPAALAAAKVTLEEVERLHPHADQFLSGLVRAATGLPPIAHGNEVNVLANDFFFELGGYVFDSDKED